MAKDLKEFSRDRFWLFMSILGLVFYVGLFWFLPSEVDESFSMGVVTGQSFDFNAPTGGNGSEGLTIVEYDNIEDLTAAVEQGDEVVVGMALDPDLSNPTIQVYIGPGVPVSLEGAMEGIAAEIAYSVLGVPPPVSGFATEEIILGEDRAGDQVSLQEKFRPMLAFMILMVEMMALAGLIASEIQTKTVKAITVTPARVSDFLTAKAIFGTALAFIQVVLLLVAIGGFGTGAAILATAVFLGSILVTGFGLLAGSIGKDFISIIFWSMLFLIPLLIPAMALLFPGSTAPWIKVLPSWPLAQVLVDVTAYGAGWVEMAPLLGLLALWGFGALGLGWAVLGRRVQTL
ncbi:MAG: ABC transporter permease [Actinomycetota bacterium]|nr:ABC transporter permease [Actinomycetota bacterium]